jgi:hypothetical protein
MEGGGINGCGEARILHGTYGDISRLPNFDENWECFL